MKLAEFNALKAGDRIDGRNNGDGTVEQNGDVLIIRWDRDRSTTYALNLMATLWGTYEASPMRHWFVVQTEQPAEQEKPTLYWVAAYRTDRCYGGAEEGGWYYNAGELVTDPAVYAAIGHMPQCFAREENAVLYLQLMAEAIHGGNLNDGLHPPSSVLSEGQWLEAELHENALPLHYPAARPHYE